MYDYYNGLITMSDRVKDDERKKEKWLGETVWDRTLTHEMFHAFGIPHTQTRPDRNEYIKYSSTRMPPIFHEQFEICEYGCENVIVYSNSTYECDSIMHSPQRKGQKPKGLLGLKFLVPWTQLKSDCFREKLTPGTWPTKNDWNHFNAAAGCKKNKKKNKPKKSKKNRKKNKPKGSKKNGKKNKPKRRIIGKDMQSSEITPNTDNNCRCDSLLESSQEFGADYAASGEYGADYTASGEYGADYAASGEYGADYAGDFHDDNDDKCYIV